MKENVIFPGVLHSVLHYTIASSFRNRAAKSLFEYLGRGNKICKRCLQELTPRRSEIG
jgi:hypothetical protein